MAPRRAPAESIALLIVVVVGLVVALPVAIAFRLVLGDVCPLHGERLTRVCSYGGVDLLGGWVSMVAVLFVLDMIAIAGVFLISARQARA